ncbi:hypothetical protein E2C01_013262 [Portunus trituberculatus]|uniref:Uncharacterized protein n=1 Tax=Portunus trituberculatus TaxID=210409 RepID=A0A5B7DFR3_PORTR|nr:hypothetical protein [Portunus trituberculatus]
MVLRPLPIMVNSVAPAPIASRLMQAPSTTIHPQPPSGGISLFLLLGIILTGAGPVIGALGGGLLDTSFLLCFPPIFSFVLLDRKTY